MAKEDVVAPIHNDDTVETLEIHEAARNPANGASSGLSPEEAATLAGKLRRSSMTTYTVNIGPTGGQVQREVRRLAGLMPAAFMRPNGAEGPPMHATSFDDVEEMGAGAKPNSRRSASGGGAPGAAHSDSDSDDNYTFQGPVAARQPSSLPPGRSAPVKAAFSNVSSSSSPFDSPGAAASAGAGSGVPTGTLGRASGGYSDDYVGAFSGPSVTASVGPGSVAVGGRTSLELVDVGSNTSASNLYLPAGALEAGGRAGMGAPASRAGRPGSLAAAAGHGGAAVGGPATGAMAGGGGGSGGGSHLSVMKGRKGPRRDTGDGYNSSPGPVSPVTPPVGGSGGSGGGWAAAAGGGGSSGGGAASTGTSPTCALRLPTLPAPQMPHRGTSTPQIGRVPSFSSTSESRPGSSRMLLKGNANPDRRGSMDQNGVSTDGSLHGGVAAAAAGSPSFTAGMGGGGGLGAVGSSGGGGGGGRWFQQDTDDVDYMLAGNDEMLQRLFTAGGGPAGGTGYRVGEAGDYGGGVGSSFTLPRLSTADMQVDRATAKLHELRQVQASVEDQLARERQAIAAGRVRRSSVLEDVAGQHQPRWQVTYNPDAPVTHAKLGMVDASRRSEIDRAHLAKIAKEQKAGGVNVAVSSVSPVVARARRLSTVVVA